MAIAGTIIAARSGIVAGASPVMDDERTLLEAWAAGDDAAGDELLRRCFDLLYRFFAGRVEFSDAADLVQRTLLACVEARARLSEVTSFRAFVLGIARHVFLKHQRKEGRRRRSMAGGADRPPTRTFGSRLVAREQERLLLRALRGLPFDLQLVLELYYWEGMPTQEIAAVIEIPKGTVLSRLHRARQALRERIAEIALEPDVATTAVTSFERWAASVRDADEEPS
jgi:RNA polymerase sigma-70 factor (ECF subfamily)